MEMKKGNSRRVASAACRQLYMAELARGGSYIASTLSVTSERAAVLDVVREFCGRYGSNDLTVFMELLAQVLEGRNRAAAANVIRRLVADTKLASSSAS
ncbi:hypothetical protein LMG28688_02694 [Paraburkholderia caffeinitolerans]|uniref:Uncharacterized protein n=1 Tax=Paraburkholderia caffeinitolerans TaxID=1723730 RepID=A0A6J5FWH7_9BURK|nr:hypothetical protein [Paraburkholderia caffeinitolerans]CAB3788463.1 hypothetical protein LMG28688_02694 [Paraburkholderia caffeinitolerans]